MRLEQNSTLESHELRSKRLVFEFSITANAVPADKVHASDLSSVCVLRSEGKTSEADAIEDLSGDFTTPVDNSTGSSVFGVLLHNLSEIQKVYSISVSEQTALATSLTVTKLGENGLTPEGNIAFEIAGAGLALDTESPTILVTLEYLER